MNHGRCINCWWYKAMKGRHWITICTTEGMISMLIIPLLMEIVIARITTTGSEETVSRK